MAQEAPDGDTLRLSRPLKALLTGALLAITALFLAGTVHGSDRWWPFGPWRMYATSTAPSGPVGSTLIQVKEAGDDQWRPASLNPDTVGLNRAEVEGRMPQIQADPSMLGTLLESHARLLPDAPQWQAIRVVRSDVLLENGVRTGEVRESTLAVWPSSARTPEDDNPRTLEEAAP
ncbi:hypothetical protein GCM10022223_66070 [Kineosporia mesophila]|uniref:Uncharacterized protein n=1 Tax=Kineosporia mesophila TaxID=566012 RepID=A0ABP7AQ27_9ACTN